METYMIKDVAGVKVHKASLYEIYYIQKGMRPNREERRDALNSVFKRWP